ncbi:hypothetical protein [Nocardioides sp. CFH 31398]|uniref:hypothetical protein n=1 Tax=Nocardioides sp. CFH 31398 TaxID=2919579 RepID=UPI001F06A57B|nr:hypothetical protein [Nocardioides sp. CFH 31398]MCH1867498.1 hypothetical protein [Nocardioides sp. CFH 31398]
MSTTRRADDLATTPGRASARGAAIGLAVTLVVMAASTAVPLLTGWEVWTHSTIEGDEFPPLHSRWDPKVGPGTIPAVAIAVLGLLFARKVAERLSWRPLLAVSYVVGLGWLLSLAYVDGSYGISRVLGNPYEYLITAREITDIPAMIDGFTERIPYAHPDNWVVHIAGHPPGMFLYFVWLDRLGLGGDWISGIVVTLAGATTPLALMVAMRALGAEAMVRRALPFLVLGPAALFTAVSADALIAVTASWGLALMAIAGTRSSRGAMAAWGAAAGVVLGWTVMTSWGIPLIGLVALTILWLTRSWWLFPVVAGAALVPVLVFSFYGFHWWEAFPVLRERYWDGLASDRPAAYWMWGNLGALAYAAGPAVGAGLGRLAAMRPSRLDTVAEETGTDRRAVTVTVALSLAMAAAVTAADLSRMSKAEVERIWLPFVPWLLLATALLPARWRTPLLGLGLVVALVVQHLFYTSW